MIFDPSKYTGEKQGKINLAATKRTSSNSFKFINQLESVLDIPWFQK